MAITYTYEFPGLDVSTASNDMVTLHYRVVGVNENGTSASVYGTISAAVDPTNRPYTTLTQAVLEGWFQQFGNDAAVRDSIATQITALENPVTSFLPVYTPPAPPPAP